jgi:apolipoprotein N-acyltransferase
MVERAPSLDCDVTGTSANANKSKRATIAIIGQVSADLFTPLLSGALVAWSFMSPPAGLLAWIALVPFAWALARPRASLELYLGAYAGGLWANLSVLDFIRTRVGDSAGMFGSHEVDWFVNGMAWAAFWPLTLYVGRRFVIRTGLPLFYALPIIWIASEFMREEAGWIVSDGPYPWLQIGTTQAPNLRVIQVADLAGCWAILAVIAAVNGAVYDTLATRRIKPVALAIVVLAATLLYGEFRQRQTTTDPGPSVALMPISIQPNAARQPAAQADLLVWSELRYREGFDHSVPTRISELEANSRTARATLIIGSVRHRDELLFNSAIVVDPRRGYLGCYDKNFLVPWSEFQPWNWPGQKLDPHPFTPGTSRPVFSVAGFTCGVSICYDACFDRSSRGYSPTPDFFVACSCESSDPSGYIRRAMLDMTRFRAVESRRAFVRNVEDGFSGVVSSTGEFAPAPEQPWAQPVSVGPVPIDRRATVYAMAGNWLPYLCLGIIGLALLRSRRRN